MLTGVTRGLRALARLDGPTGRHSLSTSSLGTRSSGLRRLSLPPLDALTAAPGHSPAEGTMDDSMSDRTDQPARELVHRGVHRLVHPPRRPRVTRRGETGERPGP